jgi:hypothetical protein
MATAPVRLASALPTIGNAVNASAPPKARGSSPGTPARALETRLRTGRHSESTGAVEAAHALATAAIQLAANMLLGLLVPSGPTAPMHPVPPMAPEGQA